MINDEIYCQRSTVYVKLLYISMLNPNDSPITVTFPYSLPDKLVSFGGSGPGSEINRTSPPRLTPARVWL
jgi:hypothetical protein